MDNKTFQTHGMSKDNVSIKARKDRLAAELRANLQKRKAQARSRRTGEADARPEGISAASEDMTNAKGPKD